MNKTYIDPTDSAKDKYRFLVGDTDMSNALLYDEEIEFVIDSELNHYMRLATLYNTMSRVLANKGKRSLGPQSEDYSTSAKLYADKALEYERKATSCAIPRMNMTKPIFSKGIHDNV